MMSNVLPHDHGPVSRQLLAELPQPERFEAAAGLLKLMSDSTRIRIFWLLCHCQQCVMNISALLDITGSTASHHLKLLKSARLVVSRREGREVYYTAAQTPPAQVLHELLERITQVACPADRVPEEPYDSAVQTVNEVHALLTADLSTRYTIGELAARFHINQTTLKAVFKTVFGQSIAAYMKGCRIRRAKEYLRGSGLSIAQIAAAVGYESQSKFTQVFKSATGQTPRDYRRQQAAL